jgi:hypothetical protein
MNEEPEDALTSACNLTVGKPTHPNGPDQLDGWGETGSGFGGCETKGSETSEFETNRSRTNSREMNLDVRFVLIDNLIRVTESFS